MNNRIVAMEIVRVRGHLPLRALQELVFRANCHSLVWDGDTLSDEPALAMRRGVVYRSLSARWHRGIRLRIRRAAVAHRALVRRVRRWNRQESARRNGYWLSLKLNVPGDWSNADVEAQVEGLS